MRKLIAHRRRWPNALYKPLFCIPAVWRICVPVPASWVFSCRTQVPEPVPVSWERGGPGQGQGQGRSVHLCPSPEPAAGTLMR